MVSQLESENVNQIVFFKLSETVFLDNLTPINWLTSREILSAVGLS